ncbi:hypothetical protein DJ68_19585 [Halorubrum sp. C3]|nr:hypothetical protein DJ68_19585 [Halorubrum sp. C3]
MTRVRTKAEALEAVRERSPDCLVSEYALERETGIDLLRAVREPDDPVVRPDEQDRRRIEDPCLWSHRSPKGGVDAVLDRESRSVSAMPLASVRGHAHMGV